MPINTQTLLHSLSAYPPWLVAMCAVIAGIFVVWLVGKLLKWSLMVIGAVIFIFAGAALVWLVFR
jgi:hypothetical protein